MFKFIELFLSISLFLGPMLTGCESKPVTDTVFLVTWDYAMIKLADDAQIQLPDDNGVEIFKDGVKIAADQVQPNDLIVVKRINPDGGMIKIVSYSNKITKIYYLRDGDKDCPSWASGIYLKCDFLEGEIHK